MYWISLMSLSYFKHLFVECYPSQNCPSHNSSWPNQTGLKKSHFTLSSLPCLWLLNMLNNSINECYNVALVIWGWENIRIQQAGKVLRDPRDIFHTVRLQQRISIEKRGMQKRNVYKHLPAFVMHCKQVYVVVVAAAVNGYTLLWKSSPDLAYPELSKSPDGQVFCWERSGAAEGQLQIPHSREVEEHLQHRGICEPNGQVAVVGSFFHGRRQHRFAIAHQVCQAVITITDICWAAAVANCVFLGEN